MEPSRSEDEEEAHAEQLARECNRIFLKIDKQQRKTWAEWMQLAERFTGLARSAMRLSGANAREGRGYNECMSRLLRKYQFGDEKLKQTRAALLNIVDHRAAFEQWRATLTLDQQQNWLHPRTLWNAFDRHHRKPGLRGKSSPGCNAKARMDRMAELADENAALKSQAKRGREALFEEMTPDEPCSAICSRAISTDSAISSMASRRSPTRWRPRLRATTGRCAPREASPRAKQSDELGARRHRRLRIVSDGRGREQRRREIQRF
jgi:hypothetical protein